MIHSLRTHCLCFTYSFIYFLYFYASVLYVFIQRYILLKRNQRKMLYINVILMNNACTVFYVLCRVELRSSLIYYLSLPLRMPQTAISKISGIC